jgi:hypothetical protein
MRENRTYGLTRGRWHVRHKTACRGLLHHQGVGRAHPEALLTVRARSGRDPEGDPGSPADWQRMKGVPIPILQTREP